MKLRLSCEQLPASRTRSSSSCKYLSNSATTSRGFRRRPSALNRSTQPASTLKMARSLSITGLIFGRNILMATSRLSKMSPTFNWIVPKCTCATLALAIGVQSKLAKTSSTGRPYAFSSTFFTSSVGNGGTRSCNSDNSPATSGGIRSGRVDSTCPNLTKHGPSDSSAKRSRSPRGAACLREPSNLPSPRSSRLGESGSTNSSSP